MNKTIFQYKTLYFATVFAIALSLGSCELFTAIDEPEELNQKFQVYGSNEDEQGTYMSATTDGGYILGGQSTARGFNQDLFLVKVDAEGQVEWNTIFGDANNDDVFHQVISNGNNGYYLLADTVISTDFGPRKVPVIMELNAEGVLQESMLLNFAEEEEAVQIEVLSSGDIALLTNYDGEEIIRFTIVDFEEKDLVWTRSYAYENFGVSGASFRTLSNGGFVIAGTVHGSVQQIFMLEIDDLGGEVNVRFIGSDVVVKDFEILDNGDYMVLTNQCKNCFSNLELYNISSDFNTTTALFQQDSVAGSYIQKIGGELIITGVEAVEEDVESVTVSKKRMYLRKVDVSGNTIWSQSIDISNTVSINRERTQAGNAVEGLNGNFFVIGTHDFITHTKMALFQFLEDGTL